MNWRERVRLAVDSFDGNPQLPLATKATVFGCARYTKMQATNLWISEKRGAEPIRRKNGDDSLMTLVNHASSLAQEQRITLKSRHPRNIAMEIIAYPDIKLNQWTNSVSVCACFCCCGDCSYSQEYIPNVISIISDLKIRDLMKPALN